MLRLFPPTLSLYLGKMLLVRSLAFLGGLILVLQSLDLLQESSRILAVDGNGTPEIMQYLVWRLPQLITQFLPFAVLLGSLLTLSTLAQNSEITIMKASGLSAHRILAPLLIAASVLAVGHVAVNEFWTADATRKLTAWKDVDYARIPTGDTGARALWVSDGGTVVKAASATRTGSSIELSDVLIYDMHDDSKLRRITSADRAIHAGRVWTLLGVRITDVGRGETKTLDTTRWSTDIDPTRFLVASIRPNEAPLWTLMRAIDERRKAGLPVQTLEAGLYHKFASPLSSIIMPLLGAVAGFGLARSGKLFIRVVIGMATGFAYFVADNFMIAMGEFGAAPPLMAAWAPLLLFILIGESILFRTEE